jgi:hypothetical protein
MATDWDAKKPGYDDGHLEHAPDSKPSELHVTNTEDEVLALWSEEEQLRIIRRVDYRLIPICGIMYCVSLLDRTNLSNAAIAG